MEIMFVCPSVNTLVCMITIVFWPKMMIPCICVADDPRSTPIDLRVKRLRSKVRSADIEVASRY